MQPYILGFDTETTGVNPENGDKIIEIALIGYDLAGNKISEYIKRIDPERPIDPKAQAVHGIAYADLVGCPKFADVAQEISDLIQGASLIVAHNFKFDGAFITAELSNAGVKVPQTPSFCTMENGRWACFDGKYPKLGELCFVLGVNYDPSAAHAASYDVEVMIECFFKAYKRGMYSDIQQALESAA